MLVYHGSNREFDELKIDSSLVSRDSSLQNEGIGVYFSLYKDVAQSYGRVVYTLDVNDRLLLDFRRSVVCRKYIRGILQEVRKTFGVSLSDFISVQSVFDILLDGGIAVCGVCREISMHLDASDNWYAQDSGLITNVMEFLEGYDSGHLVVYLFPYHIKGVGVLKDVSSNVVSIVGREIYE